MTARLMTAISVSISAACAVAPAAATAGFSSELVPVTDAVPTGNTQVSDVAIAPNGDALVAWSQGDATAVDAKVRRIHSDGTLGPILNVSDGSQPRSFTPKLAVTADGRTLVAWVQNISSGSPSGVRARWIEPDDTLGAPITVRNGGVNSDSGELAAAAMTNGTVMLAFHNFSSTMGPFRRVEARRVDAVGNVGAILAPTSGAGSLSVQVEAASGGAALLSWREGAQVAQAISAADGIGGLQGPYANSASGVTSADGNDHFHLLYREGSPGSLKYRPLSPSGASGTEQTIDANSPSAGYAIATNAANRSVALWTKTATPGQQDVNARIIEANGLPAASTSTTSVPTESLGSVVGGITGDGQVPLAWSQTSGGVTSLAGRVLSADGDTAPTTLSGTGNASSQRATVADSGLGVVAWAERLDPTDPNSNSRILLRQILPRPTCADATGQVIQGRPTRLDLACSGVQLEAPAIVAPPEHGTVAAPAADQSVVYTPEPGFDGTDSFTFTAVNRGGPGAVQRATIDVGADIVRPKIKRFKLTKKGKRKFKLRYSEPATAKILIERRACTGERKRCRKFERVGRLRARKLADKAKVPLKARIGGSRISAGSYRATAVASDAAKNRSKPRQLRFTVGD
jgi:hypothetical protein